MKTDPERTMLDEIATVDPELAAALAADVADAEAQHHSDRIGLPDLSALDLF